MRLQLGSQFREQHLKVVEFLREIRAIESRGIRYPSPWAQRVQFNMTGGVTTFLETA